MVTVTNLEFSVIIATLAIRATFCLGVDPTKVCFPKQLQMKAFDLENLKYDKEGFTVVVDFDRQLFGVRDSFGNHLLKDPKQLKIYDTDTTGVCYHYGLDVAEEFVLPRCLPADAERVPEGDGVAVIGHGLAASTPVQAWQYYFGRRQVRVLAILTAQGGGEATYPILIKVEDDSAPTYPPGLFVLYTQVSNNVTRHDILRIPGVCPPFENLG